MIMDPQGKLDAPVPRKGAGIPVGPLQSEYTEKLYYHLWLRVHLCSSTVSVAHAACPMDIHSARRVCRLLSCLSCPLYVSVVVSFTTPQHMVRVGPGLSRNKTSMAFKYVESTLLRSSRTRKAARGSYCRTNMTAAAKDSG